MNSIVIFKMYRQQKILMERYSLDRRRIEDGFYQYAVLRVCSWYPQHFKLEEISLHSDCDESILNIITRYHDIFMEQYSSKRHTLLCSE